METQTNQTNIINPPAIGWRTIRENWQILGAVLFGIGFLFVTYDKFKTLSDDMKNVKAELKELKATCVEKHDFEDLDEKVTRQWNIQNDNNNKLRTEFNPVRDWMYKEIGKQEGYEQARRDYKK